MGWYLSQGADSGQEVGLDFKASRLPQDGLPASLHLLKVPRLSKPVPPARNAVLEHIGPWGHFLYKPQEHSLLSSLCRASAFVTDAWSTSQITLQDARLKVALILFHG